MKTEKNNWIKNPTKRQIVLFTTLWLVGMFLLIISMTDLFNESIFQKKYLIVYFLIFGATSATFILHFNYWKSRN